MVCSAVTIWSQLGQPQFLYAFTRAAGLTLRYSVAGTTPCTRAGKKEIASARNQYSRAAFPLRKSAGNSNFQKIRNDGQFFKKPEIRANHSKNRRLRPIRSKTVRTLFAIWGIESSRPTTGCTGSAAQKLAEETTPARNCGLCEHWLNDSITALRRQITRVARALRRGVRDDPRRN